jgi:hypothetical protein
MFEMRALLYYFNKAVFSLTGYCNHRFIRRGHDDTGFIRVVDGKKVLSIMQLLIQ